MVGIPKIVVDAESENEVTGIKPCSHLKKACRFRRIEPKIRELKRPESRYCKTCAKESDRSAVLPEAAQLWLCLGCGNLFCGRYDRGHAAAHHQKHGDTDCLMWNIDSFSCWCYLCDDSIRHGPNQNQSLAQVEKYWLKHAEGAPQVEEQPVSSTAKEMNYRSISPGLQNLGNTCFFNSVIQLLASVEDLHEIISPHPYKERSTLEIKSTSGLSIAFSKLLTEIYASESLKSTLKPGNLFAEIHRKFPQFTKGAQQDAQELLHFLLDGLKTDEAAAKGEDRPEMLKRTRSRRKTTGEEEFEMSERRKSIGEKVESWKPQNYIESIFEGRLASIVVCSACKAISTTYDQFETLSLSIVQEKSTGRERKSRFRAAIDDFSRKGRNSLSLTRQPSTRRGTSMARSGSRHTAEDSDAPAGETSPRTTRSTLATNIPISMSEAVSEEEGEPETSEHQIKAHTFSMSDAKHRLERLSFAFSKKSSPTNLSSGEPMSRLSTAQSTSSAYDPATPAASVERLQYIEQLLRETDQGEVKGTIEDSLKEFTAVECLEGDNAFACEECAKLSIGSHSPSSNRFSEDRSGLLETTDIGSPQFVMTSTLQHESSGGSSSMDLDRTDVPEVVMRDVSAGDDDQSSTVATTVSHPKHIMRKAYKRFLIADLPNVLILHLKRFQQSGKSIYSSMRKNDAIVRFDQEIELGPYLMPRTDATQPEDSTRYRCIGAVVHIGTINSGHYVAYFLTHKVVEAGDALTSEAGSKERQWVFASDTTVRPCTWAEVAKSRAYLVWYQRIF